MIIAKVLKDNTLILFLNKNCSNMYIINDLRSDGTFPKKYKYINNMQEVIRSMSNFLFLYGRYFWWILLYKIYKIQYITKDKIPKWNPLIAIKWDIPNDAIWLWISLLIGMAKNKALNSSLIFEFLCWEFILFDSSFISEVSVCTSFWLKLGV